MKKKIYWLLVPAFLTISFAFAPTNNNYFEIAKNIEIFSNLYKEINTYYVDQLDPGQLMKTGIDAMLESLDPYTNYYSETQMEGFRYLSEGRYDGIGARVKKIGDFVAILEIVGKSPAMKAGLKAGDRIIEVNGASSKGKSRSDLMNIVRGAPGTDVTITVDRPGEKDPLNLVLTRGSVSIPNVPYSGFVADGVGYITLTTFTNNAGRNVANALRDLRTENPDMSSVVLDLRGNGGGLLREAINVSNVFIDKNEEVVSTKGKVEDWDQIYKTRNEPVDLDIKVAVLINKSSASASEIVSGVIQDLDRGVLIGQRSFGKGLVQNTRDIGYNSKVKLTTSKYYIPSGRCIQSVEYENGEPKDIADDLRTPFKTRNGRTVLDGGGVKPDVYVRPSSGATLLKALKDQDIIFNYISDYVLKNKSIDSVEAFKFNEYDAFLKFVTESDFEYVTKTEKQLEKMVKSLEKEEMSEVVQSELAQMEASIDKEKKTHLQKYKNEIVAEIEMDIISRYYFQNGKVRQKLKHDPELMKAISILNDDAAYSELLK